MRKALKRFDLSNWLERNRVAGGPVRLDRQRIYILPTRAGLLFALVLLAMLIGAMNYGNSLAYALTFLLVGVGMTAMLHTFRNLHGLWFHPGQGRAVFAGDSAVFPVRVENNDGYLRLAICLGVAGTEVRTVDIPDNGALWVEVRVPAPRRGRLRLPRCTVETNFPVGLFRAWSYLLFDMQCIVYPRPAGAAPLPLAIAPAGAGSGDRGRGADDFAALRGYHYGDSPRHIYWQALARGQGLLTKQFGGEQAEELWLRWGDLPGREVEARLGQLCRWVVEAQEAGLAYGLELPNVRVAPGRGEAHQRRCLEELALYGEHDE